jgi:hypothetical protein
VSIVSINGIALFLQFIGDIFLITTVSIIIDILRFFMKETTYRDKVEWFLFYTLSGILKTVILVSFLLFISIIYQNHPYHWIHLYFSFFYFLFLRAILYIIKESPFSK